MIAIAPIQPTLSRVPYPQFSGQDTDPLFYYGDSKPGELYPVSNRPYACEVTRGGKTYYANNDTKELWIFEAMAHRDGSSDAMLSRRKMHDYELREFQDIIRLESGHDYNRFFLDQLTVEFNALTIEYEQEHRVCHMSPPKVGPFTSLGLAFHGFWG